MTREELVEMIDEAIKRIQKQTQEIKQLRDKVNYLEQQVYGGTTK